jgi:Outer membrane protein beta-barrel domain
MKTIVTALGIFVLTFASYSASFGQLDSLKRLDSISNNKNIFDKKWQIGLSYLQAWTSISGQHEKEYFYKPSVGFIITLDYNIKPSFGLYGGLAYQQRGSGINNADDEKGLGNADSTNRERLRFNCVDLHLGVNFRGKRDIIERVRWSGSLGLVVIYNYLADDIFYSVEDGFHKFEDVTESYNRVDVALEGALGLDINVANATILRIQAITNFGLTPVSNNSNLGGNNRLWGIKLGWLF